MPNKTTKFPAHFTENTATHASSQIRFALEELRGTDLDAAHQKALDKFKAQTRASLPAVQNDAGIDGFLNQTFPLTEEYIALQDAHAKLKKMEGSKPTLSAYLKTAHELVQAIYTNFDLYLKQQKGQFHNAYKNSCPDEQVRNELWKKYEVDLKKYLLEPVNKFEQDTDADKLLSQSFIHHLNNWQLGNAAPVSTYLHKKTEEKFVPQSQYTDKEGKSIHVQYDKKHGGRVSEIRVDSLSGGLSSGSLANALEIAVASCGRNIPFRVVLPVTQSDILSEMNPGLTMLFVLFCAYVCKKLEEIHYRNKAVEAAVSTGIPLENISLVDSRGQPIVLSEKLIAQIKAKQAELEGNFSKHLATQEEGLNNQQQPPNTPTMLRCSA